MRCTVAALLIACATWMSGSRPAHAALSGSGGTGVWEVMSAESHRPARLELGVFSSFQRLALGDSANTRLNDLRGGVNGVFGIPGGFEVSGTLPIFGRYATTGDGLSPFDNDITARLGDVAGRLRWSGPFLAPGMRWGTEGEVVFATGDDERETYPGRTPVRPYTVEKNQYVARTMMTWDGLRAGSGVPLRLHTNAAYTFQGDEGRYLSAHAPLPLELPAPDRNRDNDYLTLSAAVEFDLPRLTLFGEIVTDQFVHQREALRGEENRIAVTPGVRLWMPGGVSLTGAYSMNLSEDDGATAFDPKRAWGDHEWRFAVSLGTVYRGARARAEDAGRTAETAPAAPAVTAPAAAGPVPSPAAIVPATEAPAMTAADSAAAAKKALEKQLIERRGVQEDAPKPATKAAPSETLAVPAGAHARGAPAARPASPRLADTDGDGIPDAQDQCPLLAEDWDGFQDLDGCPDVDNDQDGIPDVRDQCPNDPETFNGYYDFDGCPDEVQARWIGPHPGMSGAARQPARAPAPADSLKPEADTLKPTTDTLKPTTDALKPATDVGPAPAAERRVAEAPAARDTTSRTAARSAAVTPAQAATSGPATPPAPAAAPTVTAPMSGAPAVTKPDGPAAIAAPAKPALARTPLEDSLRTELAAERSRAAKLESELAAARATTPVPVTTAADPAAASGTGAAPATTPGGAVAATGPESPAQMEARLATLQERIRLLELEQLRMSADRSDRPAVITSPSGPTVISPPGTAHVTNATRIAELEAELERLRTESSTPPVAPDSSGARDRAILQRLEAIQAQTDSLLRAGSAAATEPPAAEASEATGAAMAALDAVLPVGYARVFDEVQFESGSALLRREAMRVVTSVAHALAAVPAAELKLVGHTDNVGRRAANLRLSRERARTVADALVEQGVARTQVVVEGRGEEAPVASNATEDGRRLNRRVEFIRIR